VHLVNVCCVTFVGPWDLRRGFKPRSNIKPPLGFEVPLHARVEPSWDDFMTEPRLGYSRDFFVSRAHPMRVQNPPCHGIDFGHDGVPVPVKSLAARPWFLVLNERCAVWVKPKLAAKVAQNLPRVVARYPFFGADFVVSQSVFRARCLGISRGCVHLCLAALK
jgi:hypothetical protein